MLLAPALWPHRPLVTLRFSPSAATVLRHQRFERQTGMMATGAAIPYDYFMTDSDEAAVAEARDARSTANPCVEGSGVDPFRQMAVIESVLTGLTLAEISGHNRRVRQAIPGAHLRGHEVVTTVP